MSSTTDQAISQSIDRLTAQGATGLDQYEQKLRNNAKKLVVLSNMLFEGQAALMFLQNGFKVAMRGEVPGEAGPDLRIELDREVVYVEVTHFLEKEQDRLDDKSMSETAGRLVQYGDTVELEGAPPWEQIAKVARRKVGQYMAGVSNILVVESSSPSTELVLGSAVHQYDDEVLKSDDLRLRRLSGIMLVQTDWIAIARNVDFCPTAHAAAPLSARVASTLYSICIDFP